MILTLAVGISEANSGLPTFFDLGSSRHTLAGTSRLCREFIFDILDK